MPILDINLDQFETQEEVLEAAAALADLLRGMPKLEGNQRGQLVVGGKSVQLILAALDIMPAFYSLFAQIKLPKDITPEGAEALANALQNFGRNRLN